MTRASASIACVTFEEMLVRPLTADVTISNDCKSLSLANLQSVVLSLRQTLSVEFAWVTCGISQGAIDAYFVNESDQCVAVDAAGMMGRGAIASDGVLVEELSKFSLGHVQ